MDPKKLELLFSITVAVLKLLVLAQKAGLLVRGRASSEVRSQIELAVYEAERILQEVEEYKSED